MADTMILERVEANLTRLRLPRVREILSQMIKTAEDQGKSFLSLLDDLLEEEVAQKEQQPLNIR
jgi:DNA replication protein DnaC